MTIKPTGHHPIRHTPPASAKSHPWLHGLEKLIRREAQELKKYEQVGPNSADPGSANGKAAIAKLPAAVRSFLSKQETALADNDGDAALYKFPLSDVSSKLKGAAYAVRWSSEDGSLDRMWLFDATGHGIAKGSSDTGGELTWKAAKGPFTIDDTPHS